MAENFEGSIIHYTYEDILYTELGIIDDENNIFEHSSIRSFAISKPVGGGTSLDCAALESPAAVVRAPSTGAFF